MGKLEDILKRSEESLSASQNPLQRLSNINLIIQLRRRLFGDTSESVNYKDTKLLIKLIIESVDEGVYGYDHIDLKKIGDSIDEFDCAKRYNLYCFLVRSLSVNGYEDELRLAKDLCRKAELSLLWSAPFGKGVGPVKIIV